MLLVVPLTLADSNQHNLADSTGFCGIMANFAGVWRSLPNLAHVMLLESSGVQQTPADSAGMCRAV